MAAPSELVVSGQGFSPHAFGNGVLACSNRTYVWEGVDSHLEGWQFTQVAGGELASVSVFAPHATLVTVGTAEKGVELTGWKLVQKAAFTYSDKKHTAIDLYQRRFAGGETLSIPQGGWSGTFVLAPSLQMVPAAPDESQPPGTIIARSPKPSMVYLGSPSLAVLPNGDYVASHDLFGPGTTFNRVQIYLSTDQGKTWRHQSEILGAFWSTLFVHRGALYLMGQNGEDGSTVIRRSNNEGGQWTTPNNEKNGLLTVGRGYSNAPTPVVEHQGRLWRGMEIRTPGRTGRHYSAFTMSAPVDADLLNARSWTSSNLVDFPEGGPGSSWLEGNAVVSPSGQIVNILRVERTGGETAAVVRISPDGANATFDAAHDYLNFPGGSVKFTIRFDTESGRYWSIVNQQRNPDARRNRCVLVSSADLRVWRVEQPLLEHPDLANHAFQYVDWQFEGKDIVFVSRTAWDGSHSFHDANFLTFHRIIEFRDPKLRALN